MAEAEQRLPKPESLEAKFKLLQMLPYHRLAKRRHCLVFGFILDWYHSGYGDAFASFRHISQILKDRDPSEKGLYVGDIHGAIHDLIEWGYLTAEIGGGRSASRYVPVWDLVCSVRETPNTTVDAHSVRETPNTSVRDSQNATTDSVLDSPNQDPSTPTRAQDPETGRDGQDCAAPLAPPAEGLAATAAESAQDDFEKLWLAYDYKKNKREARAAFRKLAPDANLLSTLIDSAVAWRSSWAAQGNSAAPRFRLDNWLEREEYDCVPPTGFKPKVRKARERQADSLKARGKDGAAYPLREHFTITGSNVVKEDYETTLFIDLISDAGELTDIYFGLESRNEHAQQRGQQKFSQLCSALGINHTLNDSAELHGRRFIRVLPSMFEEYVYEPAPAETPAPANDNPHMIAEAA